MDTKEIVNIGRDCLQRGELASAKKQAKAIAKHWEETQGPTDAEWAIASPFLAEILATQAIWSSFKLKPKATKKFFDDALQQIEAEKNNIIANLETQFGRFG